MKTLRSLFTALALCLLASTASATTGVATLGTPTFVTGADSIASYSVAAGANRLLVITVSHADDGAQSYTTVTFGGQAMTKAVEKNDGSSAVDSIWYRVLGTSASATSGAISVTRPDGAGTRLTTFLSAQAFQNVDQTTPTSSPLTVNNPGANSGSTLTVTSASGDLVMDLFDLYKSTSPSATAGGSQTVLNTTGALSLAGLATYSGFSLYATSVKAGAASVVTSWSSANDAMIHVAMNIKLATATPVPTVTAISPTSGSTAGGTSVTITGTGFTGATGVTIGGTAATSVTVVSATSITCTTPAHAAGAVSVVVTTPGGANTENTLYTYVAPTPSIGVSVSSLALGTTTAGTASTPAKSFFLTGGPLTADLVVTAPTGVELSQDGNIWHTSETLTPTDGSVGTTLIYARISASASAGSISGNIACTSTGVTAKNVSVTGTVNAPAVTTTGSQGFSDIGAASASPADINTATNITIANLISTGSQSGYFAGLTTQIFGPVTFNVSTPGSFSFGNGTFGSFVSTAIVETENTPGTRSFYVRGTFTAGTFNPTLTPTPAPASLLISFTQSPAGRGAISDSATLSIPPTPTPTPAPAPTPTTPTSDTPQASPMVRKVFQT